MACDDQPDEGTETFETSPDGRFDELAEQLREMRVAFETYKAVTNVRLQTAEEQLKERRRVESELRDQIADLMVKNAVFEERERIRERSGRRLSSDTVVAASLIFAVVSAMLAILVPLCR